MNIYYKQIEEEKLNLFTAIVLYCIIPYNRKESREMEEWKQKQLMVTAIKRKPQKQRKSKAIEH